MFDPLSNFKLNKILSAVNALPTTLASSFTEVKNAIAGVDEKVVYNGEGIDDLKANTLLNAGSVVKSVQRGVFAFSESKEQHITISPVNLDKSVLIVDIGGTEDAFGNAQYTDIMYAYLASSTDITIETPITYVGFPDFRASWQVIEFY